MTAEKVIAGASRWHLAEADCREFLKTIPDKSVDAIITDPPYELGFMGAAWDRTGVAYSVELWREALRIAKPGAYLAAFGGTRTYHRVACAIEDAGWEIRDTLEWIYGSGFPKNTQTALKPSHEPIVLARKPLDGTVAANVQEYGTGALNVDACRVGSASAFVNRPGRKSVGGLLNATVATRVTSGGPGRWPPNLLFSHAEGCELVGTKRVRSVVGGKTGASKRDVYGEGIGGGETYHAEEMRTRWVGSETVEDWRCAECCPVAELAAAARFFPVFKYCPKAPPSERAVPGLATRHPTQKPLALMRWICRLVTPPYGVVLDPFAGSGTTLLAATEEGFRAIGIENDASFVALGHARLNATVKHA